MLAKEAQTPPTSVWSRPPKRPSLARADLESALSRGRTLRLSESARIVLLEVGRLGPSRLRCRGPPARLYAASSSSSCVAVTYTGPVIWA